MTRLAALDALGRGFANVRGNAALVLVSTAGSLAVLAVLALSLVPWLGSIGVEPGALLGGRGLDLEAWAALVAAPARLLAQVGVLLLSLTVGMTVGSIVFAWYHGGVLGVLAAGDAQAPSGAGRPALAFRTWSWRLFAGEAARLTARVLLFYCVQLLFWLALAVLAGLVVFAATAVSLRSGATAAFGVGCGGALPVAFGLFAVFAATLLGQADLPGAESRTLRSVRLGFHVLGRRLGAAIGLVVLLFTAAIALGVAFTMADLGLAFALGASPSISISLRIALFLAQLLASSWLNLAFAGAFLALLRSERAIEAAATA